MYVVGFGLAFFGLCNAQDQQTLWDSLVAEEPSVAEVYDQDQVNDAAEQCEEIKLKYKDYPFHVRIGVYMKEQFDIDLETNTQLARFQKVQKKLQKNKVYKQFEDECAARFSPETIEYHDTPKCARLANIFKLGEQKIIAYIVESLR